MSIVVKWTRHTMLSTSMKTTATQKKKKNQKNVPSKSLSWIIRSSNGRVSCCAKSRMDIAFFFFSSIACEIWIPRICGIADVSVAAPCSSGHQQWTTSGIPIQEHFHLTLLGVFYACARFSSHLNTNIAREILRRVGALFVAKIHGIISEKIGNKRIVAMSFHVRAKRCFSQCNHFAGNDCILQLRALPNTVLADIGDSTSNNINGSEPLVLYS